MSSAYYRGNNNSTDKNMSYRGKDQWGSREQRMEEANKTIMEQENDRQLEELGAQVNLLKSLSIDIRNEVNSQNKQLDSMGSVFGSTTNMFKSTIGKLGEMLQSNNSQHMYLLVAFVVLVFIIIYFSMNRK